MKLLLAWAILTLGCASQKIHSPPIAKVTAQSAIDSTIIVDIPPYARIVMDDYGPVLMIPIRREDYETYKLEAIMPYTFFIIEEK